MIYNLDNYYPDLFDMESRTLMSRRRRPNQRHSLHGRLANCFPAGTQRSCRIAGGTQSALGRRAPERLYQVARRIPIAQMQHTTYNEYLLVLIGREKIQELSLLPLQKGFSRDYDENVNSSILNEFTAAAFRFGHSLVPGKQEYTYYNTVNRLIELIDFSHSLINQWRVKERDILLRQHFFKTTETYAPCNLS
jgi:hypothetical protein